ncbi:MAG: translation elongation factor Ts [Pseudomonadota bacterium]
MNVDMAKLRELRNITQAGISLCRKALLENNNDVNASVKWLREKNVIRSAKSNDRQAGVRSIYIKNTDKTIELIVMCTETDFVMRNDKFTELAHNILNAAAAYDSLDSLMKGFDENIKLVSGLLGEKIVIEKFEKIKIQGSYGLYVHRLNDMNKSVAYIDSEVEWHGEKKLDDYKNMLNDIAVHITAVPVKCLYDNEIDSSFLKQEKEIFLKLHSGKPENIQEKMWNGKKNKLLSEFVLIRQNMMQDESITIDQCVKNFEKENNCTIHLKRFQLFK